METQNGSNINKDKFNIGYFFLSLGTLITLITSVVSFLNLVFETLNKKIPDVLTSNYQYGYNTYDFEGMRAFMATLIIFFPIFVVVFYFWKKFSSKGLGSKNEIVRRWMIYIILFLSALVIAIDLVVLVKYLVSGEQTARFMYKVLVAFVTASIIGKYFYISEFWHKNNWIKKMNKVINPTAGIILVILAIVFGFLVMGSPAKQRILRMDEKRVSDLQSIQSQIINFWQQKEKLPNNLVELSNPMSGYSLPIPPNIQNGEVYEYAIKDKNKLNFQLCATFALPMPKGVGISLPTMGGINESWNHDVGRTCYDRTIDKEIYPPFEKTKK